MYAALKPPDAHSSSTGLGNYARSPYSKLLVLAKIRQPYPYTSRAYDIYSPENEKRLVELLRPSEVPPCQVRKTTPYNHFTVVELRKQIKDRGLRVRGPRLKENYVDVLFNANMNQPFRFLDLSAELRVIIYELVLKEPTTITATCAAPKLAIPPALLQVNRKIRQEASPVYFGINRFAIMLTSDFDHLPILPTRQHGIHKSALCPDLVKWLDAIGESQLNMIQKVSFEIIVQTRTMILNIDFVAKSSKQNMTLRGCACSVGDMLIRMRRIIK